MRQGNHFDVIIIGTGPGGGMAACRLAASGLKILLLDKAKLPRHKPCGGGLPAAVRNVIDWDFSAFVETQISQAQYYFDYELPRTGTFDLSVMMVDRSRFDFHFVERALALGKGNVQLRDETEVSQVQEDEQGVHVWVKGECLTASYLIAGDGAWSKTARCLGLKRKSPLAIAIDAEVEVEPEVYEQEKDRATFNFSCLQNGYGWIFPKKGYLSCGVGAWRGRAKLPHAINDYLARSLPPGSIRAVRQYGHPVPMYAGHQQLATRRVCLVGDAASLVDPIMGEGIRFALKSGALAAEVVGQLLSVAVKRESSTETPPPIDCRSYSDLVARSIGAEFNGLFQFIAPIFFSNPEFFYRKFFYEGNNYFQLANRLQGLTAPANSS